MKKNTNKKDFEKAARTSSDHALNTKIDSDQHISNFANGTTAKLRHDRRHSTKESVEDLFDFDYE